MHNIALTNVNKHCGNPNEETVTAIQKSKKLMLLNTPIFL